MRTSPAIEQIPGPLGNRNFSTERPLVHIFGWLRAAVAAGLWRLGHTTPARRGRGTQPPDHPPPAVISGAGEVLSPRDSRQSTERTWYLPLGQRGELCRVGDDMHVGSAGGAG